MDETRPTVDQFPPTADQGDDPLPDLPHRPRIAPLPPPPDDPGQLNIFRTLAHNPNLARAFMRLGGHLLGGDSLPAREREIVILRTGFRSGSEYEFGQHTRIGRGAGLSDAEIARLARHDAEWDDADGALVAMVDDLCDHDVVSETTWQRLCARWTDAQLLELLVLAGYYRLVSGMLNSAGIALEPATAGWPDGTAGARRAPRDNPA
jgi:4-carboxymuconolactone decarboxylase